MRKLILISLAGFLFIWGYGQPTYQQRIEDSLIGWEKIYDFKGVQYRPQIQQRRAYSAYKVALCDTFISWVQKSYTPIGSWGTITKILGPPKDVYEPMRYEVHVYISNVKIKKE